MVYGHGYRDKADHPGEVDNRTAELAPNLALAAALLAQGFALSGSAYKDNGWAVEEGTHDLKNVVTYFRDNITQPDRYDLTPAEKMYIASFGVPAAVIDGWLLQMNGQRYVDAPNYARNYLKRNADYSGKIKNPVLTMHTVIDPLVTVSQEYEYAETVNKAGRGKYLYQTYTSGNGHCNFTGPQLITAVNAINDWVRTGTKPTAATFPAPLGFVPGFVPPPMNQP